MARWTILCAACFLLTAGCGKKPQPAPPPPSDADFAYKLKAALQISELTKRDEALASVALNAADVGEEAAVKQALAYMASTSDKDSTAVEAAVRLARAGRGDAAIEVARMISRTSMRDEALLKIAE